ncbi:MAG: flippase [Clostridiales bacterium]
MPVSSLNNKSFSSITKNVLSLSIGQGASFVLNFFSIVLAARYLGVSDFGTFTSLLAVTTILSKVIDFGFTPIVFRETTKFNKLDLLNKAILIRIFSFFCIIVVYNLVSYILKFPLVEILLSNLLLFNIILSSKYANIRELLEIPFKADLKMHFPMLFNVIDNLILLVMVVLMPFIHGKLYYFTFAYLISNLPGFLFMIYLLRKKYNFKFSLNLNRSSWLIRESMPIFGFVVLSTLYQQLDILIIKYLNSTFSVGIFSVATRLTMPLNIIPSAITYSVLPIIISNLQNGSISNEKIYKFVYKLLFLISFAIAAVISFKANSIVTLLFGKEYTDSSLSTSILAWTQIFIFHSFFTMDLLTVYNKQKYNFQYSLLLILINLAANILLIPKFSYVGASVSRLLSCIIGFVFLIEMIKKSGIDFRFDALRLLWWSIAILISIVAASYLPLFIYLPVAAIMIIAVSLLLKYFDENEILLIFKLIHKESAGNKLLSFLSR